MSQMRGLIQQNPAQARQTLISNPQLTKALFQAQILLGMVKPPPGVHLPAGPAPAPAVPPAAAAAAAPAAILAPAGAAVLPAGAGETTLPLAIGLLLPFSHRRGPTTGVACLALLSCCRARSCSAGGRGGCRAGLWHRARRRHGARSGAAHSALIVHTPCLCTCAYVLARVPMRCVTPAPWLSNRAPPRCPNRCTPAPPPPPHTRLAPAAACSVLRHRTHPRQGSRAFAIRCVPPGSGAPPSPLRHSKQAANVATHAPPAGHHDRRAVRHRAASRACGGGGAGAGPRRRARRARRAAARGGGARARGGGAGGASSRRPARCAPLLSFRLRCTCASTPESATLSSACFARPCCLLPVCRCAAILAQVMRMTQEQIDALPEATRAQVMQVKQLLMGATS